MALAHWQRPDHSKFASFVSSLKNEMGPIFTKVLMIREEENLPGGIHFSLDGMKLSFNAAKEWSGKLSGLKEKQKTLDRKVKESLVDAYVPDPRFCQNDVRFEDVDRYRRPVDKHRQRYKSKKRFFSVSVEDFNLDDRTGKLIYPTGYGLYVRNRNFVTTDGYKAIAYQGPKTA